VERNESTYGLKYRLKEKFNPKVEKGNITTY